MQPVGPTDSPSTRDIAELQQVRRLFDACVDAAPEQREALLSAADEPASQIVAQVRRMLALHDATHENPAAQAFRTAQGVHMVSAAAAVPLPPSPRAPLLELPLQFGRYTLLEKIGEGGTAQVYRARQQQPYRDVAIKILNTESARRGQMGRFQREAEVLARLRHQGIAAVYEAGQELIEGSHGQPGALRPYLVMELVPGLRITDFAQNHQLSLEQRLQLMIQTCRAVAHAHAAEIIHRDLKPANIMAYFEPGANAAAATMRVSVLDFGIARLASSITPASSESAVVSAPGAVFGTLAYLSPEQVRSDGHPDARSDVYALGLVLFELLVGRPYRHELPEDALEAIRILGQNSRPDLRALPGSCDRELRSVILKALEPNPEQRYQSAEALGNDLDRYLRGEGVHARTRSPFAGLALWARKYPRSAATMAVAMALLCTLTAFLARAQSIARSEADHFNQALVGLISFASDQSWIKGTSALRRKSLEDANALLTSRLEQRGDDPGSHYALARINLALFDLSALTTAPDAQYLDLAEKYYRLVLNAPNEQQHVDPEALNREYTGLIIRRGDSLQHHQDWPGAIREWNKALTRLELAQQHNPDQISACDDLVWGYHRLVDAYLIVREEDRAHALLAKMRIAARHLRDLSPARALTLWALMNVATVEAIVANAPGDPSCTAQLPHRLDAVTYGEALCRMEPANREYAYALVHAACSAAEAAAIHHRASLPEVQDRSPGPTALRMLAVAESCIADIGNLESNDERYWMLIEKVEYSRFLWAQTLDDAAGVREHLQTIASMRRSRLALWPTSIQAANDLLEVERLAQMHCISSPLQSP